MPYEGAKMLGLGTYGGGNFGVLPDAWNMPPTDYLKIVVRLRVGVSPYGVMKNLTIAFLLALAACEETSQTASSTQEVVHCDPQWVVDYDLAKTLHKALNCPSFPNLSVTVQYPCANFPLTPTIVGEPLWECSFDEEHMEDDCVYLYDEDVPLILMKITQEWASVAYGGCYWYFEP